MKKYGFLILCAVILFSCTNKNTSGTSNASTADSTASMQVKTATANDTMQMQSVMETYSGTFPCKDCDGIATTLKIFSPGTTYQLMSIELRKGKMQDTTIQSGVVNTERGYESDDDATVYILNDDKPADQQMYFVRVTKNPGMIMELDKNRKMMNPTASYTLTKK